MKRILPMALLLAAACATAPPPPQPPSVPDVLKLRPDETRNIASIEVGDPMEAALLQQELNLKLIRSDGGRVYYAASPEMNDRLRTYGYAPASVEPTGTYRRLVRIEKSPTASEEDLRGAGIRIVNREEKYWIAYGTIAALQNVARAGYRISPVQPNEPQPREIRIAVASRADIQKIAGMDVDIFTVRPAQKERGYLIDAGAFDDQIDAIRAAGYTVERISTVPGRSPQ